LQVGLAVDQLYGAHQTVIKPLGGHLKNLPGIAGSAILGSGRVALIVDVSALMRDAVRSRMAELNGVREFGQEIQNSSLL